MMDAARGSRGDRLRIDTHQPAHAFATPSLSWPFSGSRLRWRGLLRVLDSVGGGFMSDGAKSYNASDITVLHGWEAIRKRPRDVPRLAP